MSKRKPLLKCILASAVAVSSLGLFNVAQAHNIPVQSNTGNSYSNNVQTPFLVKTKSFVDDFKNTKVVLANKQGIPTGAAATVTDDDVTPHDRDTNSTGQTISLSSALIQNNNISTNGGGVYWAGQNHGGSILDSIIRNNTSAGTTQHKGGGIYLTSNQKNSEIIYNIENVLIEGNAASNTQGNSTSLGGGLLIEGSATGTTYTLNVKDATFRNNSVTGGTGTTSGSSGGGMWVGGNINLSVDNTLFEGNTSSFSGGAFSLSATTPQQSHIIKDSDFINNTANSRGGAVYIAGILTIKAENKDVTFKDNDAEDGGAIYISTGTNRELTFETANGHSINFLAPTGSASNDIYNAGVLNIAGDVNVETSINGNATKQGTLNLNSGTLYVKDLKTATLNFNGGSLSFQETEGLTPHYTRSAVNQINGQGNLLIDVDMAGGDSDRLDFVTSNNNPVINLTGINVRTDYAGNQTILENYIKYVTQSGRDVGYTANLQFTINGSSTGQLVTQSSTGVSYTFTLGDKGYLTVGDIVVTDEGLKEFIRGTLRENTDNFSFVDDLQLEYGEAVGMTNNDTYRNLNLNFNGYNLTGENLDGITVADGYTLNLLGDAGTPSTISNFVTAFTNEGTLNVQNITFSDNTTAIDNYGTLSLSGTNVFNSNVSGTGSTSITEGTTTLSGGKTLEQGELSISGTAEFVNGGTVTSTLINSGTISGNGTLNLNGASTNDGSITQNSIAITSGSLTSRADTLTVANGITNDGSLNLTGGANSNTISGSGTTYFTNTSSNSAAISQDVENAGTFTNTGLISGDFTNSGTATSSAQNLGGAITNTNALNLSGALAKNVAGNGTTYVDSALTLNNGAGVTGALNLNNGNVTVSSGSVTSHNVGTLAGSGNLNIDINYSNPSNIVADKITAATYGAGTLTINSLNEIGTRADSFEVQILGGTNSNLTLALSQAVKNQFHDETESVNEYDDTVEANNTWDTVYNNHHVVTTETKDITVKNSTTLSYSTETTEADTKTSLGDTLKLVNQAEYASRNFTTDDATKTYTVTQDLGTTAAGEFTVSGVTSGSDKSIIDADGHTLFELTNSGTKVNLSDVKVTGASKVATVNNGNELTLNNVEISGNTAGITNNGTLTLSGANTIANDITGANGNANLTSGTTTLTANLTQNTLGISNGATLINSGNVTSTLTNAGTITNTNGVINTNGGSNSGSITGGTTNVQGAFSNSGIISSGTLNLKNGATLTQANGGSLNLASFTNDTNGGTLNLSGNNQIDNVNLGNVALESQLTANLDITSSQVDRMTVSNGSNGIINVILSDATAPVLNTTYNVINGGDSNIRIVLGTAVADKQDVWTDNLTENIVNVHNWSDEVGIYNQEVTDTYHFEVVDYHNLKYVLDEALRERGEKDYVTYYDVLHRLNILETTEDREFNASSASETYVVGANIDPDKTESITGLGTTSRGKLTVNGVASGDAKSIIDGNGKTLFELTLDKDDDTNTQVELNNVKIINAVNVATVAADNELTLNNVEINGATGKAITSAGAISVEDSAFINNTSADNGGAVYLSKIPGVTEFKNVLFEGNTVATEEAVSAGLCGSAIYIEAASTTGTNPTDSVYIFDNVTFDNNSITHSRSTGRGGAIYVYEPTSEKNNVVQINNSLFTGNYLDIRGNNNRASGGAIYNNGKISEITETTFEGNHISARNNTSYGGALCNNKDAIITSIENVVFTGNSASGNESRGGAVQNSGTLTFNGTNVFTDNSVVANATAYGGAIHNDKTMTFNGTSTFTNNSATGLNAYGGAIYNDRINGASLTFNGTATFSENKANGVLNDIYNVGTINFGTDSTTTFNGGVTGSGGTLNVGSGATINLGGVVSGNTIKMSGGTINLGTYTPVGTTDVNYGNLNLVGITTTSGTNLINAINDSIQNINLGNATLTNALNANLDITSTEIDHLTVADGSKGTINVTLSDTTAPVLDRIYKVVYGDDNTVKITLASTVEDKTKDWVDSQTDTINPVHNWGDTIGEYDQDVTDTYHFEVVDNHSLAYVLDESMRQRGDKDYQTYYDVLHRLNILETTEDREFNASSASETYVVGANIDPDKTESITGLGTTSRGKLTVNGVASGDAKSIIDGNGKTLFELTLAKDGDANTQVVINNTKITNAAKVATVGADNELTLNNTEISGNTSGITNNGTLTLTGTNTISNIIDGNGGATRITSGTTTLNSDLTQQTLAVSDGAGLVNNAEVTASLTNAGTVTNTNGIINTSGGSSSGSITGGNLNISGTFTNSGILQNAIVNVADDSKLLYTTTAQNGTFNNTLIGGSSAEFNKTGETLTLTGDASGFEGNVGINEGTFIFDENSGGNFFNNSAIVNVDNSELKYTAISGKTLASGSFPSLNLKNGGTFDYIAGTGETNINSGFYNSVSGNNNLIFEGGNADTINLNADFNANDTATFKNSNLNLGTNSFDSSIVLNNNSTLNLMNREIANYAFANLTSDNTTKMSVDVSLGASPSGDKINSSDGSGVLNITQFVILDDNGLFTTPDNSKTVQIIKNNGGSSLSLAASGAQIKGAWSTNVYEYEISSTQTDTENDSMKFTGIKVSDANSLKKMNNYNNNTAENIRGFSVVSGSSPYHIGDDLGKTEPGNFTVNGVSKEESIISGERAEGEWTSTGTNGSMFELTDTAVTNFNLNNVTVQDALVSTRGGSVIYSTSANANVVVDSVNFKDNVSTGNGGAFDIENANSIRIANSSFTGNSTDGLGGAIYSAVDLNITNTDFSNNTANGSKNDIYLADGADLIYTTGDSGNTISGGIASATNASEFTKIGTGDLNVSGNNSEYVGTVNVNEGKLNFTAQSANDTLFNTTNSTVNIAGSSELNINDAGLTDLATANINGSGTLSKNGAGKLNVTGDNDGFTGTLEINGGEVAYKEQGANASFFGGSIEMADGTKLSVDTTSSSGQQGGNISSVGSTEFDKLGTGAFSLVGTNDIGTVNVKAGALNVENNASGTITYNADNTDISEDATLNYTAGKDSQLTNLSGAGSLVKKGDSDLELSNYTFNGNADVEEGKLVVTSATQNATDLDFDVKVFGNAELDYNAGADSTLTLDANSKFAFDAQASDATAKFSNAEIVLGNITNAADNNVIINNSSKITLAAANYLGDYTLTDSVLDIMDSDVSTTIADSIKSYTFDKLTVNNTDLMLDVSLGNTSGSDVLNITDGSGNFSLTKLAIVDDNGVFDNEDKTKTYQIINNTNGNVGIGISEGNPKIADWSTTIYEYEINAVKSNDSNDFYDSIEFKGVRIASPDTLRIMNHERSNSRGFSVVGTAVYHIARDLDTTLSGDFIVTGNGKIASTISGNRVSYTKNPDGTMTISQPIEGENGSFFELTQDNTNLTVQNLTIQDARRDEQAIKDGSILYMNNGKTTALLDNIVFKDSSAVNGGVIANKISQALTIKDSDFTGNMATANGGVIYNASTGLTATNITADANKADGKGGAIYTNADMQITDSSFGVNSINQHKNGNTDYVANDIYIDGENTTLTFNTTNNESVINSGIAGSGTLDKVGNGTLNLHGNNGDFDGTLKISKGGILFTQNSANDTYISGTTNVLANTQITLQNDESYITPGKFVGNGTINQTGSKDLILDADNSGFHGNADISGGNLIVKDNSFFASDSSTNIDNVIEFNTSSGKEIAINNDGDLITGTGSLKKTGEGKLVLSGNNSALAGGTDIESGTLEFNTDGTATDSMVSGNINVNNNTFNVKNTSASSAFNLDNNISGTGSFNVKGKVEISGDDSQFTGTTNILSGSKLYFEKTNDNAFVGGLVNAVGDLEYTTDKTGVDTIENVIGSGNVSKLGAGDLTINNTVDGSNRFTGLLEATEGTLTVNAAPQAAEGEFDYTIQAGHGSVFNYIANASDIYNLNGSDKVDFTDNEFSTINFVNGTYNLTSGVPNEDDNTTKFTDATVNSYVTHEFAGIYALDGSVLNTNGGALNNLTFAKLESTNNSKLNIDFSFGANAADTITSTTSGGSLVLNAINLISTSDDGNNLERNVRVLNGLTFSNTDYSRILTSDLYKYTTTIKDSNTLHLVATDYADELTLYKLNHIVDGNRTFQLVKDESYYVYQDLDTTLAGTLNIVGRSTDRADTIIAKTSASDDTRRSMFNLVNNTTLNISDITIKDANTTNSGSVIYSNNENAIINIDNSAINNNTASQNGGAIAANNAQNLSITNSSFAGNMSSQNGGALYSNVAGTVSDTSFSQNNATSKGGAIYNDENGNLTLTGVEFSENISANGAGLYNAGTVFVSDGTSFVGNGAEGAEGSAIYNIGTAVLNNTTFADNVGNSYIYNGADGTLSIISEKINNVATNYVLNNGTYAVIKNNGILNLTANDTSTITVADAIESATDSVKGTINTNGTVAVTDNVINQILNVVTGRLTVGEANSAVSDALQNVDLTVNSGANATINNKNVVGGTIVDKGTLDVVNNSDITISAQLSDSGIINKSGLGKVTVNGDNDNSGFNGTINITDGTVSFETTGANFVSKDADINVKNGSTLEYKAQDSSYVFGDNTFANVNLTGAGNNVIISGLGAGSSDYTINSDWITTNENTNNLTFKNSNYVLNSIFEKTSGAADNITFDSSVVTLGSGIVGTQSATHADAKDYNLGSNNYVISNSYLNLSNRVAGDNYDFDSLNFTNGSTFSMDVNLVLDTDAGVTPYGDTFTSNSGSGIVNLTKLFITDDNGMFDSNNEKGIIQVFKGNNDLQVATEDNLTILTWATNVYKYGVTSAEIDHTADSIKVVAQGISSTDTLRDLNRYQLASGGGNRGFSFIAKDGLQEHNKYNIYRDLDTTSAENFTVVGTISADQNKKSLLDGTLKPLELLDSDSANLVDNGDGTWSYNGETISGAYVHHVDDIQTIDGTSASGYRIDVAAFTPAGQTQGSMFELVNATDFEMTNVSVENAKRYSSDTIKDGSVIYANNSDSMIKLSDVDFKNNSVENGNGGAIANISSKGFSLIGSEITANAASGNGGAIYNTSGGTTTLQNLNAYGNQSTSGLGGAIYTNANMLIADSNFGVNALNNDKNGQNDIYIAGENTALTFSTTENTTSTINSGVAGDGSLIKTGKGTLNLGGTNAGLTGALLLTDGTVNYAADDANDTFISGNVQIAQGSTLIMDISDTAGIPTQSISGVDGYTNSENVKTSGSIVKKGLGTLNLGGDNSGFEGNTTIKNGSIVYIADEDTDRYLAGNTIIGDSENQGQSANLTFNVSDGVKNQVLTNVESATQTVNTYETITKTGAGDLFVTGDNSGFYGQTTIDNGSLIYKPENTSDKFFSGNTIINTNGTLETQVAKETSEGASLASQTIGNISGNGNFVVNNEYTDANNQGRIQLVGTNDFRGLTNIKSGILAYVNNNGDFVSGDIAIDTNGTLEYTTAQDGSISNTITGNGTFNKLGTEILSITGDESGFVGTTNIKEGTLSYDDANGGKFVGGDVNITGTLDYIASQANSTLGNDLSGTGVFNKNGDKTVTITGDNSGFTGVTNINSGTLAYNNANGTFVAGDVNVSGTLDYTTGANTTDTLNNKIVGTGTVAKNGAGELVINNTVNGSDRFTGAMEVNGGTLTVNAAEQATSGEFDYSATVNDGSVLNYNAKSADSYTINGNSKFGYGGANEGSAINFKNGTYNLSSDIANATGNTISFADATVNSTGETTFSGNYALNNSTLSLTEGTANSALNNLTFAKLESTNNSKLNIDFSFGANAADTITSTTSSGSLVLNAINLISTSDDGNNLERNVRVLNGLTFSNTDYTNTLTSDLYKYTTTIKDNNTLHLVATDYATADTLYILNHEKSGNRTFQLVGANKTYYSNKDLEETLSGTLNITGRTTDKADTIVARTSATDETQHSMFDVANADTTLNISNFTIKDAKTADNGSVINATAREAVINITNTLIKDNTASGNGGAIYSAADLVINNSDFEGNSATGKGNDIYLAGGADAEFTTGANGNSIADGIASETNASVFTKKGSGDLTVSGSNSDYVGTVDVQSGNLNFVAKSENDSFFNAKEIKLSDNTKLNINDKNLTDLTAGNVSGTGEFNKEGNKKLTLTGNNANFTGDTNINSGTLAFDNAGNNAFVNGNVDVAGTLEYTTAQDGSISNTITGNGTFNKQGDKTLTLAGDAHGFSGLTNVNEGTLAYTAGTGEFVGGEVNITGALNYTTETNSSATMNNKLSGSGEFNKLGEGTLTYAGNGAEFSGTTNIAAGTLAYNNTNGTFVAGDVNVSGTLDYTATNAGELTNVSGSGVLNKLGDETLTFNETENTFSGTANVVTGSMVVQGKDNATDLAFTTNISDGTFDYTAGSNSDLTIGGKNSKLTFTPNATGSANYIGQGSDSTTFNLDEVGGMNANTTVGISDSTIKLVNDTYNTGKYTIKDSIIDLVNDANETKSFNDLAVSGTTKLNIDVDLAPLSGTPTSDVLNVNNGSGNMLLVLNEINVHNAKNNNDDGNHDLYVFDVLAGNSNLYLDKEGSVTKWATNVYEYNVDISDDQKGIKMEANKAADDNSLKEMNQYDGNRGFQFTDNDDNPYIIKEDLEETAEGTFNVVGDGTTVVSGEDENGNADKSFFEVVNDTDLTVKDLTITKASGDEGSVVVADNEDATIALNDVNITDSESNGDGGAINNKDSEDFSINGGTMSGNTSGGDGGFMSDSSSGTTSLNNVTVENNTASGNGGAINNNGTGETTVTNSSINNNTAGGNGGAINNSGNGDMTVSDSTISGNSADGNGGAINNTDDAEIELNNNTITNNTSKGNGGAVNNSGNGKAEINNGETSGNSSNGAGGAINNEGSADLTVTGTTFHDNNSKGNGGALNNTSDGTTVLEDITAYNNTSGGLGGAIYTNKDMTITDSDFGVDENGNPSVNKDKNGKNDIYIDNGATVTLESKNSDSKINSGIAGSGSVDKTGSKDLNLSGNNKGFTGDLNVEEGNVIYSQNSADDAYISGTTNISDNSSVTLNTNKADNTVGEFMGNGTLNKEGSKDVTLSGDNSGFTGTTNINEGAIVYNPDNGTSYFGGDTNINENGELVVKTNNGTTLPKVNGNGTVTKEGSGALNLSGDNTGFNGNLNIEGGALKFEPGATLGTINKGIFANGTSLDLQNTSVVQNPDGSFTTDPNPPSIESLSFNSLVINGKVDFNLDVDLKNGTADNIHADKVTVSNGGFLSIGQSGLNVVSDTILKSTQVQIASGALADGNYIRLEPEVQTVMGPIQQYTVTYGGGNLTFSAQGGDKPDIDSVNPAVMASPVATQIGGFLTQSQTLQDGFFHMNRYTKYTRADRMAAENANKYAIESGEMPLQDAHLPEVSQGMWVKPYATFEKVNLRGGYKVENFAYGTLYGGDNDMVDMGSGWKGVLSAFIGYNGNHMNYKGISMDMQGGTLGATGTLYKGNFFTGLTISTGASAGEAYTQYGTDNFSMLTAGIASKTGYNWEINGGKLIIQPSLFTGYTFVNTFDYTNAAGVRIDSDPLHAIQIIPGVKIIGNLENGWQPYAGVDMVWNIMDSNKVMANDVKLPQLSVKPYVQYGVGVQKSWGERFTAFFQTMLRGGGRNGVALTAGFRWVLGKEKPQDQNTVPAKKVIKKRK